MGVKIDKFEVEQEEVSGSFIGMLVRNRMTNFRFWVINVYGPAQHEFLADFISDITSFCEKESLPLILGGILISLGIIERGTRVMVILG